MARTSMAAVAMGLAAVLGVAACSSSGSTTSATPGRDASADGSGAEPCPVSPVDVVVTVNQWGDIVEELAGQCAEVTTIINGGDVDPHEFEPTPADNAAFTDAELVVVNGLDYDHWAENVVDTLSVDLAVVDAGEVVGLAEGDNPHLWYGPAYVEKVAGAITDELKQLAPDASSYFDARAEAWNDELTSYLDEVETVKVAAQGKTYGATESVFDYMAEAVGLVNDTPEGYQAAAANESDPSPADINAFQQALRAESISVLVYNSQTEGSVPEQLRSVAEDASVPVVEVTESVPPGQTSFFGWQKAQLQALAAAVGG